MKTQFVFPNTSTAIVVWYRDGVKHETKIVTPHNTTQLQTVMLSHRVGYSEIRSIKADPDGQLVNTGSLNLNGFG